MADRPKISIKPSAPARDPRRLRVRGVSSPRPVPDPGPGQEPRAAAPRSTPAHRDTERLPPPGTPRELPHDAARERPRAGPREGGRGAAPDPARRPPRTPADAGPAPQPRRGAPERAADGRPARGAVAPPPRQPRPGPTRPPAAQQRTGRPPAGAAPRSSLSTEGLRVSKLITERGIASRREADDWIAAGWVRVDGRPVVLGQRVLPDAAIEIDPRARAEQARLVTVLLNKPIGYVSGQAEDGHEPAMVLLTPANRWSGDSSRIEFHPGHLRHLAPAGRLDIDSTGLLVFTQDGRIAKRLIGDETRVEKEYLVRVSCAGAGSLQEADLECLRHGLELDGVPLRPAAVSWQNEDQLRVVLREGRKRQIRRMCELVGLQVLGLKRVRIGSVPLGPLPPGQWRYLRDDERF
jgi:23S rRNA pseudouridine2604 synthase